MNLVCIQESNLNLPSSFRISGYSSILSDCSHSWSGILSPNDPHAGDDVIIFVRQDLSFPKLSTFSLALLDPYSNCVGVNVSLNNSFWLSFLKLYALPICSSSTENKTDSFSPFVFPSFRNLFILGDFNCHHSLWDSKGTSDPRGEEVFDWFISSDLLFVNHPDSPTFLRRSSSDLSFAPSSLAPGRCFRT